MRLIDGDDLYRKVVEYNGGAVDKTVAKRLIEQQPTVQRNSTQSNASNTLNALDTIYRQAVLNLIENYDTNKYGANKYLWDLVYELPSAQPEIIRCRDCKHYDGRPCGIVDWYNTADDFCSRAERRTDDT